jgi:hypothetical protein
VTSGNELSIVCIVTKKMVDTVTQFDTTTNQLELSD